MRRQPALGTEVCDDARTSGKFELRITIGGASLEISDSPVAAEVDTLIVATPDIRQVFFEAHSLERRSVSSLYTCSGFLV